MRGTYRFYQNGSLVGKSENLITDGGRRHILRYLAGQERSLAGSIAVGAGMAEPLGSDTRLTYEFERATIYLTSPSYSNNRVIFKSTLPRELVGTIYEVGLYSTTFGSFSTGNPSGSLASFESTTEAWTGGSFSAGNQRVGSEALRLTTAANGTVSSTLASAAINLSGYANTDRLTLAFYCLDSNTSSVRMRLRGTDPAAYYEFIITSPMQGYNVRSFTKSSLTKVGNMDFANVDSLEVSVSAKATGATTVDFDGLRVEAFSPDIENILISRSVLDQPITKTNVEEMDIEYSLDVSL